jgi:hypothetical protein
MNTDGPFKDKNGRVLEVGDIVKLSDELREIASRYCHTPYGHVWLADPWDDDKPIHEWVLSYNHTGSESSDRLKEIPSEWIEFFRKATDTDFDLDFPE